MIEAHESVRTLLVFFVAAVCATGANAELFLTDSAGAADIWVKITDSGKAADCWVHESDITDSPSDGDIWAIVTGSAQAADKWIFITDSLGAADPLACLLED